MPSVVPPDPGVTNPPHLTIQCSQCPATYPLAVTMDDRGQILDDPLDFADYWAHRWTHEVTA